MEETRVEDINKSTVVRKPVAILISVFSAALLLRFWSLYEISLANPFYEFIIIDAKAYDDWGWRIASGEVLGKEVFYQDPLYPYFLGLVYFIFGHKVLPVLILQAIMGAFSTVLVFLIAVRIRNYAAGLIAALLWAFYAPMIFYESILMKEGLAGLLILLTLYFLVLADGSDKKGHWFGGGLAIGLSVLTRGNMLLMIPFVLLWIVLKYRSGCVRSTVFFLAGIAIILGPVAIRNSLIGGEFMLTTAQAGQNFYWGNNPSSNGTDLAAPDFLRTRPTFEKDDFAQEAMRRAKRKLSNSEVSRFWFARGLDFMRNDPATFAKLQIQKLRILLNDEEISDNYQYYFFRKFSPLLRYSPIGFGLVAALGLLGLIVTIERRSAKIPLYLFLFSYSGSIILFLVTARYRLPVASVLVIFAASALVWLWEKFEDRNLRVFGEGALLLVLSALACFHDIPWLTKHNRIDFLAKEGGWLYENGKEAEAISVYEEIIRLDPKHLDGHYGLGNLYFIRQEFDKAAQSYQKAFESEPRSALIASKLGISYIKAGEIDRGIPALYRSIRLEPNQSKSYLELSKALELKGRHDEAEKYRIEYMRHIGKEKELY